MMYIIEKLEKKDAEEISNWKYQDIYDFYSHSGTIEEVERLMKGPYYSVKNDKKELIGYYCFGVNAQVPNGHDVGAYDDQTYIDMGLGLKPELTGLGKGAQFVRNGVEYAKEKLQHSKIRLTVATFNKRAIKTYEKVGFKHGLVFDRIRSNGELIHFVLMHLE